MLVSKIGRPWKFHVFPKNTLVLEVFDVKGNLQKIWNFVETLSRHICISVLIFIFLLWIVLFLWLNEFRNHVFLLSFFMPEVACITCFNTVAWCHENGYFPCCLKCIWSTLFGIRKFLEGMLSKMTAFWTLTINGPRFDSCKTNLWV